MGVWTPGPGGTAGDDTFTGDGTNETADGLAGNDTLNGGDGDDTLNWTVGDGRDTIDGGADVDAFNPLGSASADLGYVTWNGTSLTSLMDNGLANIENINLDLEGGVDWLIYNATAAVSVNLLLGSASGFVFVSDIEKVIGGSGDDSLTGNNLDNRLDGQGGADTLDGGAGSDAVLGGDGNDTIYASVGNDSLQGQNGNDTFIWTSTDGRDTFNGGADTDTVNLTGSAVADVADTNWNGAAITGLMNNALIDVETVNLDLGAGGAGGDWLRYNTSSGVTVILELGTATGFASITGVENVIGGTGNDDIVGDAGVNKINGNSGDDFAETVEFPKRRVNVGRNANSGKFFVNDRRRINLVFRHQKRADLHGIDAFDLEIGDRARLIFVERRVETNLRNIFQFVHPVTR